MINEQTYIKVLMLDYQKKRSSLFVTRLVIFPRPLGFNLPSVLVNSTLSVASLTK